MTPANERRGGWSAAWWIAVCILLAVQIALGFVLRDRASRDSRSLVVAPLLLHTGQPLERELARQGILLPDEGGSDDPSRFGADVADRLGRSGYLGPTLSPDDLVLGLHGLEGGQRGLSEQQRQQIEPLLSELHDIRRQLDDSGHRMHEIQTELGCTQLRIAAQLDDGELDWLRSSQPLPPDGGGMR